MSYALLTHTKAASVNTNNVATGNIDTTGASILFIIVSDYVFSDGPSTPTDNYTNTYVLVTPTQPIGGIQRLRVYRCDSPAVGTGHNASYSLSSSYPSIIFASFSGSKASGPLDQENGASSGSPVASLQGGSITPTEANELVLSALALGTYTAGQTSSIDSGFTIIEEQTFVAALALGVALAYLIQTTATAANPTWSWPTAQTASVENISFKAAGAAATYGRNQAFMF